MPEDCSAAVAALYESCVVEDPTLRPSASDIVSTLEQQTQELWTHGLDPKDVEILRGPRGRAVGLGRGAYATVYLARWQDTLVAVKVMNAGDSDAQQEVQAEADTLGRLRHPNVVFLMGVCILPPQRVRCNRERCKTYLHCFPSVQRCLSSF